MRDRNARPPERAPSCWPRACEPATEELDGVPPDVLPLARRRKRLRVAQADTPEEVASEPPDSASDEVDRFDTPEPARTLAVEKPPEQ